MAQRIALAPVKLSWGSIIGGTFVALGVWVLLLALGLALGLSTINPQDAGTLRAVGIGTGIWSLIAPLIALFIGGMVASRTGGLVDRTAGMIHGAVLWGLTTIVGMLALGLVLTNLIGGLVSLGGQAVSGGGSAIAQVGQSLGIDYNDVLAPINQQLEAQGRPTLTANQLQAATQDAVNQAVREGRLDRELVVSSLTQNTDLSRQDAEAVATRLESQISQQAGGLQEGALAAAEQTGAAFWGVFFALLLGLIAAMIGGRLGVSRGQQVAVGERPAAPVRDREVHV